MKKILIAEDNDSNYLLMTYILKNPDFCGNPETGEYTGDNSKSPSEPKRSITPEQFENRMILRRAMIAHGFNPLDTEWWHFTLKDEPFPDTYFTFPVKKLK